MRFTDTRAAGRALAAKLGDFRGRDDAVVIGVARGGVAVALEVSKRLGLPLDLALMRRLLLPRGPEDPVCAVSVAGALRVDEEASAHFNEDAAGVGEGSARCDGRDDALKLYLSGALEELARSARACRGERPPLELARKTVLVVDNGVRTGSTARAVVRALRTESPARVVVAVPVADPEARAAVESFADDFIYLAAPRPFGHVGLWYANFRRPGDDEIRAMLEEAERLISLKPDCQKPRG
jgi:putative phosphoribosyl transferase